jgi:hypothetical protein
MSKVMSKIEVEIGSRQHTGELLHHGDDCCP